MLVANIQINELRAEIQPAIVVAIPKINALAALDVQRRRGPLHGPRKHRVVAIVLHHFAGMRVHESCPSFTPFGFISQAYASSGIRERSFVVACLSGLRRCCPGRTWSPSREQ